MSVCGLVALRQTLFAKPAYEYMRDYTDWIGD